LTLGRHFDTEVEVHSGHEVVRRGPYALVRHPVYSGLALHLLGACIATGNVLLIAGTLFGAIPAFYIRASVEERLLRTELGPAYAAYARDVGMLVPFIGTASR
jgi:protein-S-isoprenylcysteine O-methyltransferase Ste14